VKAFLVKGRQGQAPKLPQNDSNIVPEWKNKQRKITNNEKLRKKDRKKKEEKREEKRKEQKIKSRKKTQRSKKRTEKKRNK